MVNSVKDFINWLQKPIHLFLFLLSLVPIIAITAYVAIKGVNIPVLDQWEVSTNIAIKTAERSLTFNDLISPHFNHRIFFTNLLTAILTLVSGWNTKLEMFVGVTLAVISLVLLISMFRFDHSKAATIIILPFSLLVFSLRQVENWRWGFGTCSFFVVFFFYAGLWVVRRSAVGWRPIAIAAILSFCATYSLGAGVVVWPSLFVVLLILGYRHWKYIGFWIGSAVLSLMLFLKGYNFSGGTEYVFEAGLLFRYITSYLGSPLMAASEARRELMMKPWLVDQSMIIGIGGVLIFFVNVIYLRKKELEWKQLASWLALGGFALGVSILTAVIRASRLDFNFHHTLISRYVTVSTPFWIALVSIIVITVLLIAKDDNSRAWDKLLSGVNITASVLIIVLYINANFDAANLPPRVTEDHKDCMLDYPASRNIDCILPALDKDFSERIETIWQLAKYRLSSFAESKESILQHEFSRPIQTSNDYKFDIYEPSSWKFIDMVPENSAVDASWILGEKPRMVYMQPLDICLSDYTHVMIVMSKSPYVRSKSNIMHIYYQLDDQEQYEEPISIVLLPEEIPIEYFYDLRLLNLDPQVRMSRFRFDPIGRGSEREDIAVTLYDLRLIRSSEPSRCTE